MTIYVDPFWFGFLCGAVAGVAALFVWAIVYGKRKGR
jgi:hypothetical protein